jgi:hypothetical protein
MHTISFRFLYALLFPLCSVAAYGPSLSRHPDPTILFPVALARTDPMLTSLSAPSSLLAIRLTSNVDPLSSGMDTSTSFPFLIIVYFYPTAPSSPDTIMHCGFMLISSGDISQTVTAY